MTSKGLWQSCLVSPVILGATLFASSGVLAQDGALAEKGADSAKMSELATVTTQLPTDEPASATAVSPLAANLQSKQENSAAVNTEPSVSVASVPVNASESNVLEQINRYSNESDTNSVEEVNNISQLGEASPNDADASESSVLEQIDQYSDDNQDSDESDADVLDQVTNVSQLRDVSPGDWAFEALRSLVERYGCIAGYPDGTYRGNRAMTRYEFAAGLNACLQQVERLIGSATESLATKEDLKTLERLLAEFGPELAQLRGRVDAIEARTTELEATQFSTTTKLNAQVIFAFTGIAAGDNAFGEDIANEVALGDRVRLNFDTSFTGKDLLRTRLQALNLDAFSANTTRTPEGDLRFAAGTYSTSDNNQVAIDALLYQFPIGEKTTVVIEANAGAPDDFTNTVNPRIDGDGDNGALSNFGTRNPIYNLVSGAGIGIRHEFSDALELSLGYLASDAASPNGGGGLFNGPYGALAQLTIKPIDKFTVGLTYIHSYKNDLTAGSNRANLSSFLASISAPVPPTSSSPGSTQLVDRLGPFGGSTLPTSSNSYGLEAVFEFTPNFTLGGWVGYTATRTLSTIGGTIGRGDLSIWNWAVTLAVSDLGTEGSVAGIIVGMEPKVTGVSNSLRAAIGEDQDTSLHIEGFYQFQLTENIAITPGVIWLTAPDHNANNDDIVIGAIRTTFSF